MAVRRGTITYADGSTDKVVLTSGDQIRANREAERRDGAITKGAADELLLYRGFLAAEKANLRGSEKSFLDWADDVAEFDIDLTEEMIKTLYASGDINEKQRDAMLDLVPREEPLGESTATLTT